MSRPSLLETTSSQARVARLKKKSPGNPLQRGIWSFLVESRYVSVDYPILSAESLPKRFTIYSPLLLLPVNFLSHTTAWQSLYSHLDARQKVDLFSSIAAAFTKSGQNVTHIALNAPIPASETDDKVETRGDNVLRRPRNLVPVHGDFGPSALLDSFALVPSQKDLDAAFWVMSRQSPAIIQVWAPRWTMFSRGNVSEKERILGANGSGPFPGLSTSELGQTLGKAEVLDMYVGIGYFAFSYLARGVKRVWGWDLNPWSIEGLRRGCEANGWRSLLVRVADNGSLDNTSVENIAKTIIESDENDQQQSIRCVAFLGDNKWSTQIMEQLLQTMRPAHGNQHELNVRHVNLGLLPTSKHSWESAVRVVGELGGWLHVHENVQVSSIEAQTREIVRTLKELLRTGRPGDWQVQCQHVEHVKTYAPGVMHCVFDVLIEPVVDSDPATAVS